MDPVTIFSLVALCGTIASRIAIVARDLNNLREKYQGVHMATEMLMAQVAALQTASARLSNWIESSSAALSEEEEHGLNRSLIACDNLIFNLHQHLSGLKSESEKFTFRTKTRYLWNEGTIKDFRELLQSQVQALSFYLQVMLL